MSFSTRLKDRRENLKMTRTELAAILGVTPSAIANYENGISSPKTELLYALFDALKCDANYLYQDVIHIDNQFTASIDEWDILRDYRELDSHGREMVDLVLAKERERILQERDAREELEAVARSQEPAHRTTQVDSSFDPSTLKNGRDF